MLAKDKEYWAALCAAPIFYLIYAITLFDGTLLSVSLADNYHVLLLVITFYPVIEELVFRGIIQTSLIKYYGKQSQLFGISHANIITSIIFSLLHVIGHDFIWAASVFIPSLIFGYFRDKYESTKPSIGLHVFYNAGYYLLFWNNAV